VTATRPSQSHRSNDPTALAREPFHLPEGTRACGAFGGIMELGIPGLPALNLLDPKAPLTSLPAEDHRVETVDDRVGVAALGDRPFQFDRGGGLLRWWRWLRQPKLTAPLEESNS
jgi:hypothetical protein